MAWEGIIHDINCLGDALLRQYTGYIKSFLYLRPKMTLHFSVPNMSILILILSK